MKQRVIYFSNKKKEQEKTVSIDAKRAERIHSTLEKKEAHIQELLQKGETIKALDQISSLRLDSDLYIPNTSMSYSAYWTGIRMKLTRLYLTDYFSIFPN